MYLEKMFTPVRLQLPFPIDREAPQVARCDDPKKSSSGQPPVLGQSPTKSPASLQKCTPKKRSRQMAFGFGLIPHEKPRQPSEIYPEKSTTPGSLWLLDNPLQKALPAFGDMPLKNVHARQPSAFGRCPAKGLSSLRRYTPEKCLRPSASGCFFLSTVRLPKWPAAIARKSTTPDGFRLLVDAPRKASPAFGDMPLKNVHARRPSALDLY